MTKLLLAFDERFATDPPVSEKQRRAMWAAAEGRSKLGIPKSVGKEFVGADGEAAVPNGYAASLMLIAPDGDCLFLHRAKDEQNFAGHWSYPGGKVDQDEAPLDAAKRETEEETGYSHKGPLKLLDSRLTPHNWVHHTFVAPVTEKFSPKLSEEHSGFTWAPLNKLPQPVHPAISEALNKNLGIAGDMTPEEWDALRAGFVKWTREEEHEKEHGADAALVFKLPRAADGLYLEPNTYDAEFEVEERHRREIAANHFHYADDLGCGNARTYDPEGRYNCGRCNQVTKDGKCLLVKIPRIDREAGSCADWENQYAGDPEMVLGLKSPEAASYGVARNGIGFGCVRCPFGHSAKVPDSLGRDWWCGKFAARVKTKACCAINGAPTVPMNPDGTAKANDMAIDRASVRRYDAEKRLHVEKTNISKANVCPYFGREIPDSEEMKLDPERKYWLLRDPDELKKAASSFNNLPLLSRHVPVDADNHQPDLVIGSTGTDADFDGTYLTNSLVVWARDAIDAIEAETQKELSSAYRYRADMTPGIYKGVKYDGIMRDIVGNHVALVREGRAGSDVVVGDSVTTKEIAMKITKASGVVLTRKAAMAGGAIAAYLGSKLAQDEKLDLGALLKGVTAKNFKTEKARIITDVGKLKLAKDATITDFAKLLDTLEEAEVDEGADTDPNSGLPMGREELKEHLEEESEDEDPRKFLEGKLSKDDLTMYDEMCKKAEDRRKAKDVAAAAERDAAGKETRSETVKDKAIDKQGMDTAIKSAVEAERENQRAIREAERSVRQWVGELACDAKTPEDVYRAALDSLHVKVDGVHPSALKSILETQPKLAERNRSSSSTTVAMDAGAARSFAERYPGAARIGAA